MFQWMNIPKRASRNQAIRFCDASDLSARFDFWASAQNCSNEPAAAPSLTVKVKLVLSEKPVTGV
jgi:hypothetical protein